MTLLEEWRTAFSTREGLAPWPGPRPLTDDDLDTEVLIGRDDDRNAFLADVQLKDLIHLTGLSGVGKSSLLRAGIIPDLRSRGYVVVWCRDWNMPPDNDFVTFLAQSLHRSLPTEAKPNFYSDNNLFWDLADLGDQAVIVLDQFEELVRHDQGQREAAFEFILGLLAETRIKIVLSYRSEYMHRMRELDRDTRVQRSRRHDLDPISDAAGLTLIQTPRRHPSLPTTVIDDQAARWIHAWWLAGRRADTRDNVAVGLLHLQALLYVLWTSRAGEVITAADVAAFEVQWLGATGGYAQEAIAATLTELASIDHELESRAATDNLVGLRTRRQELKPVLERCSDIMKAALEASADTRLSRAEAGARDCGFSHYHVRGITTALARVVPHLSSGGYKLEREAVDLASVVLADEIRGATALAREVTGDDHAVARLVQELTLRLAGAMTGIGSADLLEATRVEVAARLDETFGWGAAAWQTLLTAPDDQDVSSGPVLGLSPVVVLIEQLRLYAWSLIWLSELNLARLNGEADRTATLMLVHDGFGDSLERWSRRYFDSHGTWALYSLKAPEGEGHLWGSPGSIDDYAAELQGVDSPKLFVNLGFKGNAVLWASLKNVVFVNCDFRGTYFMRCRFEGVTFLNCRLDGAMFSDCVIVGNSSSRPDEGQTEPLNLDLLDEAPSYAVREGAVDVAGVLAGYREIAGAATELVSPPPGYPAIPVSDVGADVLDWVRARQGLQIQGSRISALTFRGIDYRDRGRLVLSRVRGAGLDLGELIPRGVESTTPRIDFDECLLRHVSFTAQGEAARSMEVRVRRSAIVQWWVGAGFTGSLAIERSVVAQLWSQSTDLAAVCDDSCQVDGLIGVEAVGAERLGADDQAALLHKATVSRLDELRSVAPAMDYRRTAEPWSGE